MLAMAMCVIAVAAEAPCQCLMPGGNQTTSPALTSCFGPPHCCTQPRPDVIHHRLGRGLVLHEARGLDVRLIGAAAGVDLEQPDARRAVGKSDRVEHQDTRGDILAAIGKGELTPSSRARRRCRVHPRAGPTIARQRRRLLMDGGRPAASCARGECLRDRHHL
jgi:hypothetical protein